MEKDGIFKVKDEYFYIKTKKKVSSHDLRRIKNLHIPPAWVKIWISSQPSSSIQATGIDQGEKKQYIYHQHHIELAEQKKFLRLYDFIKAIPKLNRRLLLHEKLQPYQPYRVIATMLSIVRLLHIRAGKEHYAKVHKSYGISSLRKKHIKFQGDTIILRFKGKSNIYHHYTLHDKKIANHLKMLYKLSGDKIFQYINDKEEIHSISDTDLNMYLQKYMGEQFTIKDFRTYASNFYFIKALMIETIKRTPDTEHAIKKNISRAFLSTAFYLRHTKAISKKSYIMNFAINLYMNHPSFFIDRKIKKTDDILLEILKLYKQKLLRTRS